MICLAIYQKALPVMEYLLEKEGEQILSTAWKTITGECNTVQAAALQGDDLSMLHWLLGQGVPVDLATPTEKFTALHAACTGSTEVQGERPLDRLPLVRLLIDQRHANFRLQTAEGKLPIDFAEEYGQDHIVAYLRNKERVEARRARRSVETAAATALSEEEMRQARAAADAAAEALLAEVEQEGPATAAAGGGNGNRRKSVWHVLVLALTHLQHTYTMLLGFLLRWLLL